MLPKFYWNPITLRDGLLHINHSELHRLAILKDLPHDVYVCPSGDLFHEDICAEWHQEVLMAMFLARQHTFHVLTKRPKLMVRTLGISLLGPVPKHWHIGVSVSSQAEVDERLPVLRTVDSENLYVCVELGQEAVSLAPYLTSQRIKRVEVRSDTPRETEGAFHSLFQQCTDWGVTFVDIN